MLLLFGTDTVVAATRVGRCWQWIAAVACTASILHGDSPSALSCDSRRRRAQEFIAQLCPSSTEPPYSSQISLRVEHSGEPLIARVNEDEGQTRRPSEFVQ